MRGFHRNGRLIAELSCQAGPDSEYAYDGESKQWNSEGTLLGTSTMHNGTGIFRIWHENGQLYCEIPMVEGVTTGLQRVWYENGQLLTERFLLRGQPISEEEYRKIMMVDPSIPQYADSDFDNIRKKRRTSLPAVLSSAEPAF